MLGHLLDYLVGNRCDVRSCQCAVSYMNRVTNAGCDDLGLDALYREHLGDRLNQIDTGSGDIIQTAQERRYISSSGTGCQQRLVRTEDQCYIRLDAFRRQYFNSLQTFDGHRDLYYHVGMDLCDLSALGDHALGIYCGGLYFTADRSVNNGCNLCDYLLKITAFLCDQRRVRGNAADYAHVICLLNLLDIRGINK